MKSLKTIQTLTKMGKVFSKLVSVVCLLVLICCILGVGAVLATNLDFAPLDTIKIAGSSIRTWVEKDFIKGILTNTIHMSIGTFYTLATVLFILFLGEYIQAKVAFGYFKFEVSTGTPFTYDCVKRLRKFGIWSTILPLLTNAAVYVAYWYLSTILEKVVIYQILLVPGIGFGIALQVMAAFARYGTDLKGSNK